MLSPELKRWGYEANPLPPSTTEVKECVELYLLFSILWSDAELCTWKFYILIVIHKDGNILTPQERRPALSCPEPEESNLRSLIPILSDLF